jgi:hypothetical protein
MTSVSSKPSNYLTNFSLSNVTGPRKTILGQVTNLPVVILDIIDAYLDLSQKIHKAATRLLPDISNPTSLDVLGEKRYTHIVRVLSEKEFENNPKAYLQQMDLNNSENESTARFVAPFLIFDHTYNPNNDRIEVQCDIQSLKDLAHIFLRTDGSSNVGALLVPILSYYPELKHTKDSPQWKKLTNQLTADVLHFIETAGLAYSAESSTGFYL